MSCSLYWIHHPDHTDMFTQGYVGISNDIPQRFKAHKRKPPNTYLANAIKKYGWDTLIKKVILIADRAYCLAIEKKLRSEDKTGWNLVVGGGNPPISIKGQIRSKPAWNKGISWSEEQRKQISIGVSALWANPKYRQHMSNAHQGQLGPMTGKTHSIETIVKMSLNKLGKPSGKKGFKCDEEYIQKMRAIAIKESWVCPHCTKQGKSKGAGNRWHFDNCKLRGVA